jgi:hypothetical protein
VGATRRVSFKGTKQITDVLTQTDREEIWTYVSRSAWAVLDIALQETSCFVQAPYIASAVKSMRL